MLTSRSCVWPHANKEQYRDFTSSSLTRIVVEDVASRRVSCTHDGSSPEVSRRGTVVPAELVEPPVPWAAWTSPPTRVWKATNYELVGFIFGISRLAGILLAEQLVKWRETEGMQVLRTLAALGRRGGVRQTVIEARLQND